MAINLLSKTDYNLTITEFDATTDVGSVTLDFLVNGVAVFSNFVATTANPSQNMNLAVASGSSFGINIDAVSGAPQRLNISLQVTRT